MYCHTTAMGTKCGTQASLAAKGMTLGKRVRVRRPPLDNGYPRLPLPSASTTLFFVVVAERQPETVK